MRISVDQARPYFWHKDQRIGDATAADMRDEGYVYLADSGVCLAFHDMPWPGLVMVHVGALRGAWGRAVAPAVAMLGAFWHVYAPTRILAWVRDANRAAAAFAARCGFETDGRMALPEPVTMMGWSECRF